MQSQSTRVHALLTRLLDARQQSIVSRLERYATSLLLSNVRLIVVRPRRVLRDPVRAPVPLLLLHVAGTVPARCRREVAAARRRLLPSVPAH